MENKNYDRQFAAWAIDRALRYVEITKGTQDVPQVIAIAEQFANFIVSVPETIEEQKPSEGVN